MQYFLAEVASIALFVGFIFLVSYEQRTGRVVFVSMRDALDKKMEKGLYVYRHVDFLSFTKDMVRLFFGRFLHIIARGALLLVRLVEHHLNGLVHMLHTKLSMYNAPSGHPATPSKSKFIQSISDYKKELKNKKDKSGLS